jgi:hypothetical protein
MIFQYSTNRRKRCNGQVEAPTEKTALEPRTVRGAQFCSELVEFWRAGEDKGENTYVIDITLVY